METFELLKNEANQRELGYQLVRYKNKFHASSGDTFKNIMVNARVKSQDVELVGEIQLTTIEYLELKKIQHKYYTLKRAFGTEADKFGEPYFL